MDKRLLAIAAADEAVGMIERPVAFFQPLFVACNRLLIIFRYRVIARSTPRMAASNSPRSEPAATESAVAAERFNRIRGTTGLEAAVIA